MASAIDILEDAKRRIDDAAESARYATAALDEISPGLADLSHDLCRRAEDVRDAVRQARDALAGVR